MSDTWTVVSRRNNREVVVFDGTEDDARVFISNNFPRVHVEPNTPGSGVPDALLKSPSGDYQACIGTQSIGNVTLPQFADCDENGVIADDDNNDVVDDPDDDDEPATPAPAKKTAAPKKAPSFGPNSGGKQ